MSEATCETCKWWGAAASRPSMYTHGPCRIVRPDAEVTKIVGWNFAKWPQTHSDDWCGEHKPRGTPDE